LRIPENAMKRTVSFIILITVPLLFSCNADEVWKNANKEISYTSSSTFYVLAAAASSTNTVRVSFSREVGTENISNYSIPGLTITDASKDGSDGTVINLTTSTHEDINYILTVTGVKDARGESLDEDPKSLQFAGDVAPAIKRVISYGNTTIVMYFTEGMNEADVENTANYAIDSVPPGAPIAVSHAIRDAVDRSKVTLTTDSQTDGQNYEITVNAAVRDLTGNTLVDPKQEYFTGQGSGGGDTTDPVVLFAELVDSDTVELYFSEPMNVATTSNTLNYTIKDSNGTTLAIASATPQTDTSRVRIDITPATFSLHLYTLTVNTAVLDSNGNNLQGSPRNKASFAGEGDMPEDFTDGPVIVDPMDESNNNFSLLVKYRGRVYIGPANSDNTIFRLKPDGSDPELVTFVFHGEAPLPTTYTLDPGPDGESGIDCIASGFIGGEEYLFFGPQKTAGNLNYLYYTNDIGTQIDFTYIDVNAYTSGPTRSINSMAVFNNRLYIGLSDQGPLNPLLPKLINLVSDPVTNVDILGMKAPYFTRIGGDPSATYPNTAGTVGIDIIYPFNNVLYVANGGNNALNEDGGIARSINNDPDDWTLGDWTDITPTAEVPWYNTPVNDRFSIELTTQYKLIPSDRAFPAMASFNGNLYIARNTTDGAQLWKHDGVSTWTLVADDDTDGITELGDGHPNNKAITMLVANDTWLYVGFDNDNGIQIFRTNVADPLVAADFQAVTSDGFGQTTDIIRIYHALSIEDNGTYYLWVLCGKASNELRVYRASN
jgi:hypothetical protein